MATISFHQLVAACSPGGGTCLSYTTPLTPAGGPHATVAPAKYTPERGQGAVYAYEKRYLDGESRDGVVLDSKQSAGNRVEEQLARAVEDGDGPLGSLPHIEVHYGEDRYTDLSLPHRAFDGHIRAGTITGVPATQTPEYRALRDANPANARALFDASPVTLLLGGWDSSRRSRQGRWRTQLVGEIIGFLPGPAQDARTEPRRGGARVDPVGMQVQLDPKVALDLVAAQKDDLSQKLQDDLAKQAAAAGKAKKLVSGSPLGLGGIPPTLSALGGVACDTIIRTRVLSFAGLRQIRFGSGTEGDAACRAVLAAIGLAGVARADAELTLRANCDLREAGPVRAFLDQRGGELLEVVPPSITEADALLAEAIEHARATAGVQWNGVSLSVVGNPLVVRGALDDGADAEA